MEQTTPKIFHLWPFWFALATLVLHLAVNLTGGYGYFRDELYYIACSAHPDIGCVDQPPLSIWILAANRFLFGDSLFALRLLPALAASVTVLLAGLFARRLGGGTLAQALGALAVALSPIMLGMGGYYSMNSLDILLWSIAFSLLLGLEERKEPRTWLSLGVVLGLGLLNKISMGWLAAGIAVALIITPRRQWLKSPWPWISAALALLIFSPFVIWNFTHEFAHLEFARRAAQLKYTSQTPLTFASGLVLINNPLTLPLWLAGFYLLLREPRFRLVGIALATVVAILLV
ncbi:MAG TPA: glycosyltransferase family 39 protein, partial [Bacteroidota bacterium]